MERQRGAPSTRSEVEDEGHIKNIVIIFILLMCFVLFGVSFNVRILFAKKKNLMVLLIGSSMEG